MLADAPRNVGSLRPARPAEFALQRVTFEPVTESDSDSKNIAGMVT